MARTKYWDKTTSSYKYADNFSAGGGGGGTAYHTELYDRDADNQHPMSAITGLSAALDGKQSKITASGVLQGDGNGGVTEKTVDGEPTANSQDLVTSGGVYAGITNRVAKSDQTAKTADMTQEVGIDSNGKLWVPPGYGSFKSVSENYTIVSADVGKTIMNNGAAGSQNVITLTAAESSGMPVGSEITVMMAGSGSTVIRITGLLVRANFDGTIYRNDTDAKLSIQPYQKIALKKVFSTQWIISGDCEVIQ